MATTQKIGTEGHNVQLYLRREDLLHPLVSGNKFRKLKYNLKCAKDQGFKTLLTYGGAFSNHIAATAAACHQHGFKSIGVIRGEELGKDVARTLRENKTLAFAVSQGMQLQFVSRKMYREKGSKNFRERMLQDYEPFYELPEGGTNSLAIKGCGEILTMADRRYAYICCPAGTGGTAAGIIESAGAEQQVLVFSALKGDFLKERIGRYTTKKNWELITDYHFGGYAQVDEELINFINLFKKKYEIPLDPVYTGKMMFGLTDMIQKGYFSPKTPILAIHTGGLQGIAGINARLHKKNAPFSIHIDA